MKIAKVRDIYKAGLKQQNCWKEAEWTEPLKAL